MARENSIVGLALLSAMMVSAGPAGATPSTHPVQEPVVSQPAANPPATTTVVVTAKSLADTPELAGARDMNRVICRTRSVLGTRLNKQRECRTAAQWEQLRRQANNGADKATRNMTGGMVKPGS